MNRYRRLRQTPPLRRLVKETRLTRDDFIQPFFVVEGKNKKEAIESMPGIYRFSVDPLLKTIERYQKLGGQAGIFLAFQVEKI